MEPKVKFIIAESLETIQIGAQQLFKIVNPMNVIRSTFIPTTLSLVFAIIVSGYENNQSHKISLRVVYKQNDEVLFSADAMDVPFPALDNLNLHYDVRNLILKTEGEYVIELTIDDDKYSESFYVYGNKHLVEQQ